MSAASPRALRTGSAASLLLLMLVMLLTPSHAWAQATPTLHTGVDRNVVEVGETIVLQLTAMSEDSDQLPASPTLPQPQGFAVRSGPSISPKAEVSIVRGNIRQQVGIVASWVLEAKTTGKYRIGPPSIRWKGRRYTGRPVEVTVQARGSLPPRRSRDPFDIFDMFGLPRHPSLDLPQIPAEPPPPAVEPSLSLSAAPDPHVFIHAAVDRDRAVLGQQLTLSVYLYSRQGAYRLAEAQEPSVPDFFQRALLEPDEQPAVQYAEIGADIWRVRLMRKIALFPLRTGDLVIGPMQVKLLGMRSRLPLNRSTSPVRVSVGPAPDEGRPVGYRPGDVGSFSLRAEVTPRKISQGAAVAVTVTLEGTGNLPNSLTMPTHRGVEWMDSQVREQAEVREGRIGGTRVFTFIARLTDSGAIDLGQIRLPYYDPDRYSYAVAIANLGTVQVTPDPSARVQLPDVPDRFAAIAGVRPELGPAPSKSQPISDAPVFWGMLALGPLSVLAAGLFLTTTRRMRGRLESWRGSLARQANQALSDARKAHREGDHKGAAAAVERAVHASIEASTDIKSRGVLREMLPARLAEHGVDGPLGDAIIDVLSSSERLRFDPEGDGEQVSRLLREVARIHRALASVARKAA